MILLVSVAIVLAGVYLLPPLTLTGDEPRYLFASYSIWSGHGLSLSNDAFNLWFLRTHGVDLAHATGYGSHSVVHAALLSPVVGLWGLEAARWASAGGGVVGLMAFPTVFRNLDMSPRHTLVTALLMLTLPVLPYMRLLYAEIWLFSITAWLLALVTAKSLTTSRLFVSTALCVLLVFVHIRATPIAGVLGAYIAFRVVREGAISRKRTAAAAVFLGIAMLSWLQYQVVISGGVAQSATAAFTPSPSLFLDRLAVQLAGFRHGLLLYAPIHLLGFAGVAVAIRHRSHIGVLLCLLLVAYVLTFIWGVASESYTARFWVLPMPVVLIGTSLWIDRAKGLAAAIGALPIALFTVLVTAAFFERPDFFLANRFHSIVFDELVARGIPFNFALHAPWDPIDLAGIDMIGERWSAEVLVLLGAFVLAFVLLAARDARVKVAGIAAVIGLSGGVGYWSYMDLIEPDEAVYTVASDPDRPQVDVEFKEPTVVRGFRVGRLWDTPMWNTPDHPKSFEYEVVDEAGGIRSHGRVSGRQINLLSIDEPITRIRLRGIPSGAQWPVNDTRVFK